MVKKLNLISRERLNFRRQPILCTTLYRNPTTCGAGVYPLPTGRIRCETRNNFTPALHNKSLNCLSIQSLPTLQLSSNSSPTLSNSLSLSTLTPTLTKLSQRSAIIDKRPGVSCMWAVCQSVYSGSVPSHTTPSRRKTCPHVSAKIKQKMKSQN